MTPLTRVTGKLFGGSAPLNEIGQFGSAKAGTLVNTQDVATIQALSAYSNGWGSAVISNRNFPPIEEVTGVLKTLSYQNCYLLQEGIPAYDIGTEYSKTSIVKSITGTQLKFYISLTDGNVGNSLTNTTYWAEAKLNSGRNVGEYVWSSLPCTDAGLHLADGSLLAYGSYKEFIDYIADIYNSSLNYFCSEADWQASVTTYGSCGKFVYDSVNKTVRLPKVSDILTGITDVSALGSLVEAGLPNITGAIYGTYSEAECLYACAGSGALYPSGYGGQSSSTDTPGAASGFAFDASRSNSIYGNSNTVQPQTIKALLYIVIANTTKTAIEVDIDEIATDLNGKMDVDGSNATCSVCVESYVNGTSWYRVYSNGWCEQGGIGTENVSTALLKTYTDTNYQILLTTAYYENTNSNIGVYSKTTSSFVFYIGANLEGSGTAYWRTCGYIS